MRAGSVSPWTRNGSGLLLLEDDGSLIRRDTLNSMESHLLMCIVCALLAAVACMHLTGARPV